MAVTDTRACVLPAHIGALDAMLSMVTDLCGCDGDDTADALGAPLSSLYRSIIAHACDGDASAYLHIAMLRHHPGPLMIVIRDTGRALSPELADLLLERAGIRSACRYIVTPHGNIWQVAYSDIPALALLAA